MSGKIFSPASFVSFTVLFAASLLSAQAATIESENRYVRSFGDIASDTRSETWNVTENSPNDTGVFNQTVDEIRRAGGNVSRGLATMESNVDTSIFSASGETFGSVAINNPSTGSFSSSDGSAEARYEVRFTLDEATAFNLTSRLFGRISDDGFPRTSAQFSLQSNFFNLNFGNSFIRDNYSQSNVFSGVLDAGTYTMRVTSTVNANQSSRFAGSEWARSGFDVTMRLAPVPVPAAVWLFASGLGLLGFSSRRRRQNAAR